MRTVLTLNPGRTIRRGLLMAGLAITLAAGAPRPAQAGGFDTPILYSARHIGMGGTGIAFVYDPTALFINPAGLAHTEFISLTGNFSPILARNKAPTCYLGQCTGQQDTEDTLAPAFLVGGAFRLADWATAGIGVYPLASAGGGYSYASPLNPAETVTDETTIRFIELSPGFAFHGKRWSFGVGYRITLTQLDRFQGTDSGSQKILDLELSGIDAAGFRVGFQAEPVDGLQIGLVYRNKITPTIEADSSTLLLQDKGKTEMELTLPSRIGFGIRGDVPINESTYVALAGDFEYAFQSQNKVSEITSVNPDGSASDPVRSIFKWQDAMTVRLGAEIGLIDKLRIRGGYVWDEQTASRGYPSPFATPPVDTHSGTVGVGWKEDRWEVNVAYAYRHGNTTITDQDVQARDVIIEGNNVRYEACATCGGPGEYDLTLHGMYADFSWYFK